MDNAKSTVTCLDLAPANSAGALRKNRALDCSDEEGATMSTIVAAARFFGLSMRTSTVSHLPSRAVDHVRRLILSIDPF
jgi:hypothetical protein